MHGADHGTREAYRNRSLNTRFLFLRQNSGRYATICSFQIASAKAIPRNLNGLVLRGFPNREEYSRNNVRDYEGGVEAQERVSVEDWEREWSTEPWCCEFTQLVRDFAIVEWAVLYQRAPGGSREGKVG